MATWYCLVFCCFSLALVIPAFFSLNELFQSILMIHKYFSCLAHCTAGKRIFSYLITLFSSLVQWNQFFCCFLSSHGAFNISNNTVNKQQVRSLLFAQQLNSSLFISLVEKEQNIFRFVFFSFDRIANIKRQEPCCVLRSLYAAFRCEL